MTRKDFEELAQLFRWFVDHHGRAVVSTRRATLAGALADYCAKRNPRFDRARFMNACGVAE